MCKFNRLLELRRPGFESRSAVMSSMGYNHTFAQASLLLVARLPSKTPARAASQDPVQVVTRYRSAGYRSLINPIVSSNSGAGALVPNPPGTIKTSNSGAVWKVCVGSTDSPNVDPRGFLHHVVFSVATGASVLERRVRFSGNCCERMLRASSGPKTSRAWDGMRS